MDMIYVDSTSLDQIGFDDGNRDVHVIFRNGEHYVYSDVSQEVWDEFRNATSKGTFLNRELKAKGYSYRKM